MEINFQMTDNRISTTSATTVSLEIMSQNLHLKEKQAYPTCLLCITPLLRDKALFIFASSSLSPWAPLPLPHSIIRGFSAMLHLYVLRGVSVQRSGGCLSPYRQRLMDGAQVGRAEGSPELAVA